MVARLGDPSHLCRNCLQTVAAAVSFSSRYRSVWILSNSSGMSTVSRESNESPGVYDVVKTARVPAFKVAVSPRLRRISRASFDRTLRLVEEAAVVMMPGIFSVLQIKLSLYEMESREISTTNEYIYMPKSYFAPQRKEKKGGARQA